MSKCQLICACCGRYAGSYKQWWNQDKGYGLCKSCADWMLTEDRMTLSQLTDCYGKSNIHREASTQETAGMQSTVTEQQVH